MGVGTSIFQDVPRSLIPGLRGSYAQKVLDTVGANLIAYWPLWEAGYGNAPLFNGTTSYVNVYSASLNSAFDPTLFSAICWFKISSAVWTDGSNDVLLHLGANGTTNFFRFMKGSAGNNLQGTYTAGGTTKSVSFAASTTDWAMIAITVSKAADEVKVYLNGVQQGSTLNSLGVWAGALASNLTVIGAQTTTPALPFNGYLAYPAVWSGVRLSGAEILALYNAASTQQAQILATQSANLITVWPMSESSGTTADNAEGTAARDGTYSNVTLASASFGNILADNYEGTAARDGSYTGVTLGQTGIGDGRTSPLFDGANDYVDIYSASLASAFNGEEGTVAFWGKVSGAGVWSDSTIRYSIVLGVDLATNYVALRKSNVANAFSFLYTANSTLDSVTKTGLSTTGWFHVALTWSKAADQLKAYWNGAQEGSTQTTLGAWAGSIASPRVAIATSSSAGAFSAWSGYLAHFVVANTPLSAAKIANLASL